MPFLPVTHASIASLFPHPHRRPLRPPALWSVPKNFASRDTGIQSRADPWDWLGSASRCLGWGRLGSSLASRCGRHEGWGEGCVSRPPGWLGQEGGGSGARKRAREHWGGGDRGRERMRIKQSKQPLCFFPSCLLPPPSFFLSYPLFAKLEPPLAPPGPSSGSRCEFGSSRKNASFLGALAHSPILRSFRRWSEGRARLEPSCLHPLGREERRAGGRGEGEGRGARREGDAASTPPSGTEQ